MKDPDPTMNDLVSRIVKSELFSNNFLSHSTLDPGWYFLSQVGIFEEAQHPNVLLKKGPKQTEDNAPCC